jgi:hypothetical protein
MSATYKPGTMALVTVDGGCSRAPSTRVVVSTVLVRARDCEKCGKTLTQRQVSLGQTYCSKACYDTSQRAGIYRACTGCGQPVYRQREKSLAKEVFCTPECRAARRGLCRNCGKRMSSAPRSNNKTCSAECSAEWPRGRASASPSDLTGICVDCGRPCARHAARCRGCFLYARRKVTGESA